MKGSFGRLLAASLTAVALVSFTSAPLAEAAGRDGGGGGGGRGGGGGGGGARAGGGGGGGGGGGARAGAAAGGGGGARAGAPAGGGAGGRQAAQANGNRADTRTNDVRNSSVNSVNNAITPPATAHDAGRRIHARIPSNTPGFAAPSDCSNRLRFTGSLRNSRNACSSAIASNSA